MSAPNAATTTPTSIEKPSNPSSVATEVQTDMAGQNVASAGESLEHGATGDLSSKTKVSVEVAAERLYEERMEDEYAKREGGA